MSNTDAACRIYVACLASYNAGRIYGAWIDLEPGMGEDDVQEQIAAMIAASPEPGAEEWRIDDREGYPKGASLKDVLALLDAAEGASVPWDAALAYAEDVGAEYAAETLEEAWVGEYKCEADYAQEYAEELGCYTPEQAGTWPLSCIDWESAAREIFMGDVCSYPSPSGVYVFTRI